MTAAQMSEGYTRLYDALLADRAIAERIRNKLAHFGASAAVQRETAPEAARILWRLLAHGIVPGGPARAWHFLRSLPVLRPRQLPLAVNDWIAGLAMRDYAERHFGVAAPRASMTPERALERLHSALHRWRGEVQLALHWPASAEARISVRVSAALDRALARKLARQLHAALARSRTRFVLAFESLAEQQEVERLSRALSGYGDRVLIVIGEGLRELLRCEPASASPAAA
ncbi:MAG: Fe-S oxidoreductase [Burkholderiales bacterium]|jgi:hypothetical protein|nr:Fe-S oxidoreductase [Burkholderiales bacterium]